MSAQSKMCRLAIASAAAALFISGCSSYGGNPAGVSSSAAKEAAVKCVGVNACKGTSACATATSACKGHNACKGTGWLPMTKAECESKGGTVG